MRTLAGGPHPTSERSHAAVVGSVFEPCVWSGWCALGACAVAPGSARRARCSAARVPRSDREAAGVPAAANRVERLRGARGPVRSASLRAWICRAHSDGAGRRKRSLKRYSLCFTASKSIRVRTRCNGSRSRRCSNSACVPAGSRSKSGPTLRTAPFWPVPSRRFVAVAVGGRYRQRIGGGVTAARGPLKPGVEVRNPRPRSHPPNPNPPRSPERCRWRTRE